MKKRLGSLVDEFKELVYPPGYDPEGKTAKRKQGEGCSLMYGMLLSKVSLWSLWSYHRHNCLSYFSLHFWGDDECIGVSEDLTSPSKHCH